MSFDVEHSPWRSHEFGNLALVRAVKKRPCLYDNTIQEYAKKDFTNAAWQEIANEFGCSVDECKRKWKGLRTVYSREMALVEACKKGRPYYLLKHMDFLFPFLITRPKRRYRTSVNARQEKYDYSSPQIMEESDDDIACSTHIKTEYDDSINEYQTNDIYDSAGIVSASPNKKIVDNVADTLKKRTAQPVIIQCVKATKEENSSSSISSPKLENPRRQFILSLLPEIDEMTEKQFRSFKRKMFQLIDDVVLERE